MKHNTNISLPRLYTLLLTFFGDETLHFHSTRLSSFLTAAFVEPNEDDDEIPLPNIPRLLHTHNDLHRLLDAAHLLYEITPTANRSKQTNPIKQLKHLRTLITDWDDFPSHLHPYEWCNPETILHEFFNLQPIDGWKDTINALLQSAIGEGSPITSLSETQIAYAIPMLHRLQDAIWLLHITGAIPGPPEEHDEIICDQDASPISDVLRTAAITNFFFMISEGRLVTINLNDIVCVVALNQRLQLHTIKEIHQFNGFIKELKQLLPQDRFIWIKKQVEVLN